VHSSYDEAATAARTTHGGSPSTVTAHGGEVSGVDATTPNPALIAVYDNLTSSPRVEKVHGATPRELIDDLSTRTYQISHEAGGGIPYMVIREIVENFIHAGFDEVVVSVLDAGNTLRFADQGPGIRDKERVFLPGFTTATDRMKRVIKGVGSGLPVARECLTFSAGTIEIDDNLGTGTVVTLRMSPKDRLSDAQPPHDDHVTLSPLSDIPDLSVRHKKVLSLIMEVGALGPSAVSRELGVGLSTAYRDLEHLAALGLVEADVTGKRTLTDAGIQCLDALFGR
jgi:anti-sigma regulatory factor (Ser/Thr protein kinase)